MDRSASRYRTLSVVASNVAAAAAVAAQQDGHRPPSARYSQQSDQHRLYERSSSGASRRFADGDPGYDDEENPPVMTDSYHSDGGRESSGKRVSWSPERHRSRAASVGKTPAVLHLPDRNVESHERPSNETPVVSRRGSRASRRGSTMVFLGAWALFGIGTLASGRTGMAITTNDIGRVLVSGHTPIYHSHRDLSKLSVNELDNFDTRDDTRNESPSNEQVLGRIFAWLCTTLYLTSRLPQIWKNVSHHKSLKLSFSDTLLQVCQKISRGMFFSLTYFRVRTYTQSNVRDFPCISLFLLFLGTFSMSPLSYRHPGTSSHLHSPRSLLEKVYRKLSVQDDQINDVLNGIRYLLGSGGTLMFDITIIGQSFCYRPRHRRHSRVLDEEETGLLSGDSAVVNRGRTARGAE
jgi:hypothetical protein